MLTETTTLTLLCCVIISQAQLNALDSLGDRIDQQVHEGLKPVRILDSILNVKFGSGGTTVATFAPSGRRFIIRDSRLYECSGSISDVSPDCSGDLAPPNFAKKENYCYVPSRSVINNWYCIPSKDGTKTSFINGHITCESRDGSPVLLIEDKDFEKLCKNVRSVSYKYYTSNNLKEVGYGLECSGSNPQVCTYSEAHINKNGGHTIAGHTNGNTKTKFLAIWSLLTSVVVYLLF